jgi:tRNA A37 threonylcarbamoyladenosine biosynthesis protein TsaE
MTLTGNDPKKKLRSFVIGSGSMSQSIPEKRIPVLGATGSGKTTWVNGIANFLNGVQWTDSFRFKVVTEEDAPIRR